MKDGDFVGVGDWFVDSDCVSPFALLCVSNWFKWLVNNIQLHVRIYGRKSEIIFFLLWGELGDFYFANNLHVNVWYHIFMDIYTHLVQIKTWLSNLHEYNGIFYDFKAYFNINHCIMLTELFLYWRNPCVYHILCNFFFRLSKEKI